MQGLGDLVRLVAVAATTALMLATALGCASAAAPKTPQAFTPSLVVRAFAGEGVQLVDSGLFGDADGASGIRRSYIPYDRSSGAPIPGASVVLFFTTGAAKTYVADASRAAGAPALSRARNVVVALRGRAGSRPAAAVRRARRRLSRR